MNKVLTAKLKKFATALEKIDVEQLMLSAVKDTEELALDLNRVQMYELGIDSQGKSLGQYTATSKNIKKKKGQRHDHITLRDKGDFQDDMFVNARQIPVFIDSGDVKTALIEKRWPKALGLTPEFGEQYKTKVMEVFRRKLNKVIEDKKKILQ